MSASAPASTRDAVLSLLLERGEEKPPHTMPPNCLGLSAVLRVTMGSPLTGGLLA